MQNWLLAVASGDRIPNGQPQPAIHPLPSNFTGLSFSRRQHSSCHLSPGDASRSGRHVAAGMHWKGPKPAVSSAT